MGTLKIRGIGPIAIMSRIIYNIRDMKGGGIVDNGYTKRIRERVLSLEDGTVFVMSDFADIADTSTIRQSLSRLVQSGTLRRILKGVYEKPKYSKLLDEYVAADPEAVANALARSYHWTIAPCGNTALNLLGLSTQVTAVWSYISDGPYKTYEWNSTKLEFKHRTNKEITGLSYMTSLVIQALKTLGRRFSYCEGAVHYRFPTRAESIKMFCDETVDNLFYKSPYFRHQQEHRIVVGEYVNGTRTVALTSEGKKEHIKVSRYGFPDKSFDSTKRMPYKI